MNKSAVQREKCFNLSRSGNLGGPAAKFHGDKLGLYVSTGRKRNGRAVYRRNKGDGVGVGGGVDSFLHFNDWGLGMVSVSVIDGAIDFTLSIVKGVDWVA